MTPAEPTTTQTPFEVLADYQRRSLAHNPGVPEDIDTDTRWRGVGFRAGERHFLASITEVSELLVMPEVTAVPGTRPAILGIANVRGTLVPVLDLNKFLQDRRTQITNRSRILLARQEGAPLGVLVDEVVGQRGLSREQLAGLDEEQEEPLQPYVAGTIQLEEQRWAVFNMDALIDASQFQQATA